MIAPATFGKGKSSWCSPYEEFLLHHSASTCDWGHRKKLKSRFCIFLKSARFLSHRGLLLLCSRREHTSLGTDLAFSENHWWLTEKKTQRDINDISRLWQRRRRCFSFFSTAFSRVLNRISVHTCAQARQASPWRRECIEMAFKKHRKQASQVHLKEIPPSYRLDFRKEIPWQ